MFKVLNWVVKRHWWIIALVALLVFAWVMCLYFYPQLQSRFDVNLPFFLALLLFIVLMLEFLSRKINSQSEAINILGYKHKLSQEFPTFTDWDILIHYIVRLPSTITAVEQTYLFVNNLMTNQFECVAHWNDAGHDAIDFNSVSICKNYMDETPGRKFKFKQCENESVPGSVMSHAQVFCLPILYRENLLGVLQFGMKDGMTITREQSEIFENIGDEIAIALKIGQERKTFDEMSSTRAVLNERRRVSHYLHDHLGQNLGYVHLKLGQLISEMDQLGPEKMLEDLERMRDATSESYSIVRGTLEKFNLETTPLLTNLLIEHARKVAQRANFEIAFKTVGKPIPVNTNVQRAIYYVFKESLSNIERHAKASKVDVRAEWANDYFELSIRDNGIGFDPQAVNTNQHFGLEIMRERLTKVKGRVTLSTPKNSGTLVNIFVPTQTVRQLE